MLKSGKKYKNVAEFLKQEYDPRAHGKIYLNDLRRINFRLYNALASYKRKNNDEKLNLLIPHRSKKIESEVKEFLSSSRSVADLPYKQADKMRKRLHRLGRK